jgi:hypothetical protein
MRARARGRAGRESKKGERMMLCQIELPPWGQYTGWHLHMNTPSSGTAINAWMRTTFGPWLLPYTMRYTDRPSGIHQVVSFDGAARGDTGR